MVPPAEFTSYYGKPVLNAPVWEPRDIAGYLFLGGLAGASSLLGAGAQLTGRTALERAAKAGALGAACLSMAALAHDLGRPARFANMLRVFKISSPMSVGSWILAGYVPAAAAAAASALTGRLPRTGATATAGAALLGPAVATYTAVLISDTAVPAWHDGYPELPFVFAGKPKDEMACPRIGIGLEPFCRTLGGDAARINVVAEEYDFRVKPRENARECEGDNERQHSHQRNSSYSQSKTPGLHVE